MAARDACVEHLLELLAPFGPGVAKRMFGGHGVYVDGVMAALVIDETAYLKTDASTRDAFAAAGAQPFAYANRGRTVETSYWSVPAEALESAEAMRPWAERALGAARRKAATAPRRSARARGRGVS